MYIWKLQSGQIVAGQDRDAAGTAAPGRLMDQGSERPWEPAGGVRGSVSIAVDAREDALCAHRLGRDLCFCAGLGAAETFRALTALTELTSHLLFKAAGRNLLVLRAVRTGCQGCLEAQAEVYPSRDHAGRTVFPDLGSNMDQCLVSRSPDGRDVLLARRWSAAVQ
ncbi:MAG: hypothetical protein WC943_16305 [Elusimicrobiota bacterium]|jgi:hypothetical protein